MGPGGRLNLGPAQEVVPILGAGSSLSRPSGGVARRSYIQLLFAPRAPTFAGRVPRRQKKKLSAGAGGLVHNVRIANFIGNLFLRGPLLALAAAGMVFRPYFPKAQRLACLNSAAK